MRKRATMADVAALAGVALKTVSRVINAEPNVSPELVERVRRAAEQLDYRHNLAASNLRRGARTQTIGVILHDLSNEFAAALLRAIDDRARAHGVAVLASSLDDSAERERAQVLDLVTRRVDGIVLMPAAPDQSYLMTEVHAGLPVVVVDRPATGVAVDTVLVDNHDGAATATAYLVAHGHRRIACLTDRSVLWTARERRRGYLDALARAGIEVDPRLVVGDVLSADAAARSASELLQLDDPPTAFFAARNELSVGVLRALRAHADRKIAIVGFDDFPLADLVEPSVTVVRQDVAALGHSVCDLLFERMQGSNRPPKTVVVPTELVERGSGAVRGPVPRDEGD
jgi:LacI family transcriptional regulator